jgi:hypothetical protein
MQKSGGACLFKLHPMPRRDSISRPKTPQAETFPRDHATRACLRLFRFENTFWCLSSRGRFKGSIGHSICICICICGSRFERDLITRSCKELSVVHSGQKIGQSENDFFFCNGKGLVPGTNVKISDFFPPEKLAKKWHFRLKIRCLLKIISYFLAENWSKSPKILIILCKPLFLATLKQHK